MKTHLEELADNRVRLSIEVPPADVDHAFEHALDDLSSSVRVPGFRKGKAPKGMVMQRLGRDAVVEEALEHHLSGWYRRAVAVAGIDPVDSPTIDWEQQPTEGSSFTFSAEVEVKAKPLVKSYKGLTGVRTEVEVPREAVEGELERLRLTVAELKPAERGAQTGDFAVIDFEGSIDGTPFEGGRGTDYGVELGGGRLLDDLEKGLEGMANGDERDVPVHFPADYPSEELAGKNASFHVTMKDLKERELPPLDDELAKSVSEFDTLAELDGDISEQIRQTLQAESDAIFRSTVLEDLSGQLETEVPEAMVRSRMAQMTRSMLNTLAGRGLDMDTYLQLTGQSSEELVAAMRPEAENSVRKDLALEAVADAEGIEVTDEMLDEWVKEQAESHEEAEEDAVERLLEDPATRTGLRIDLRMQKALDIVADNAKEITPDQAAARDKLWTPEQESQGATAKPSQIWTPGSPEPAKR